MLSALYGRSHRNVDESRALISPLFEDATIEGLQRLFQWTVVDPENIDDQKYLLSKNLSEVRPYSTVPDNV